MKRPGIFILLTVVVCGCASRKPYAPDAFFGRTAIPPPGTGSVRAPSNSYFAVSQDTPAAPSRETADPATAWKSTVHVDSSVQRASHATQSTETNSATAPSDRATPPLTANWRPGSTGSATIRTRIQPPDYAAAPSGTSQLTRSSGPNESLDSPSPSGTADRSPKLPQGPIVTILQPRATAATHQTEAAAEAESSPGTPTATAIASSWTNPASGHRTASTTANPSSTVGQRPAGQPKSSSRVIEIGDLPDPGTRAARRRHVDPRVQPTSGTVPTGAVRSATAASRPATETAARSRVSASPRPGVTSPALRYGHDPAYAWLRGRLEYSDIAKRWKLRYIPIDGQIDQYGGSVVLGDTSLLSGLERGDCVEVHGKLLPNAKGDWGYAPVYEVAQIKPL